jgi:hypothetical protein
MGVGASGKMMDERGMLRSSGACGVGDCWAMRLQVLVVGWNYFAPSGLVFVLSGTQGVALGYAIVTFQAGMWGWRSCIIAQDWIGHTIGR